MPPGIYADFHNLDDSNRLRLTCAGTRADLGRHGIELQEGMRLTFRTDDANDAGESDELLVDGAAAYDREGCCWVAAVDWDGMRHASEEAATAIPNGAAAALARHGPSSSARIA